jgi:poly(beta-D-mannuronate) lyase
LNQYFQAKNCTIAFNTVVDSAGPYFDLSAGLGTSGRTLKPERITIANNVLALGERGQLLKGSEGDGWRWAGNFAGGGRAAAGEGHAGVTIADLKLQRAADGIWRPAADSPVRGAAEADIVTVKEDIGGQPRTGKADAGSDQVSDAPVAHRPLTPADVGPGWMPRTAGDKTPAGK